MLYLFSFKKKKLLFHTHTAVHCLYSLLCCNKITTKFKKKSIYMKVVSKIEISSHLYRTKPHRTTSIIQYTYTMHSKLNYINIRCINEKKKFLYYTSTDYPIHSKTAQDQTAIRNMLSLRCFFVSWCSLFLNFPLNSSLIPINVQID